MFIRSPMPSLVGLVIAFGAWALIPEVPAQGPILSEFLAANSTGLKDQDGEFSDWIELFNPGPAPVSLAGWHLTDDPQEPAKWSFPAATVPAQGFLVVFASGKNRTNADAELHTNFKLSRDGEYLALVPPNGGEVATVYAPEFPRQFGDSSYGLAMTTEVTPLVPAGAPGRWLVPADDLLKASWTHPDFDDASWKSAAIPLGYDRPAPGSPEGEEPGPEPLDVTQPLDFIIPTSENSPGNEGVINAIDDNPATKYLNFDKLNAGFTVSPSSPDALVIGLRFTSANDAPERDPTSFVLSGSRDGRTFSEVARGPIPVFNGRFTSVSVAFTNTTAWPHYRLLFPTVRSAATAVAVQIAEVELLGWPDGPPPEFGSLIRTDVEADLYRRSPSLYLRLPFDLPSAPSLGRLLLALRYEDGFVAYLNGVEVARANAPLSLTFRSSAVTNRLRRVAAVESTVNLSDHFALLHPGRNVLALQGLNSRIDSRDFLLDARLEHRRISVGQAGYLLNPTPGRGNPSVLAGWVEDPEARPGRGLYEAPLRVTLTCPTPQASLRYTIDGSVPSATNGLAYTGPIALDRTTTLRVAGSRDGWRPSRVVTHSYLFLDDVATQSRASALAAGFPATWNGHPADYDMDPRIVGPDGTDRYRGKYAGTLKADLRSLPIVSLVMPVEDLFGPLGIYGNAENRGAAWERAASIEWIHPDSRPGFQEDAGLRTQGGAFRRFDLTGKKSFRVVFRERYGPTELRYPLFGPTATDHFDNFVLRANSNDAWPYGGSRAVYVRDAFAMETARALGIPASHTGFVHLYLNGLYWGLYNPVERPDAAFASAYLGGDKEEWDSINQDSAPDGTYDAWNRLMNALNQDLSKTEAYQRLQGNNPDGTRNPAYENLLDVDNLIDYLILNFYMGNTDWPGRNWWAGRRRDGDQGFQFRPWDTETALDFNSVSIDITGANSAVARPYAALRVNADFRLRFADHVFRHFSRGGALYVNPVSPNWDAANPSNNVPAARFAALAGVVRAAIVGESARWGDQLGSGPHLRDEHWQRERDSLLADYFPRRSAIVLDQFRKTGLYPRTEPAEMNRQGGVVAAGFRLALRAPAGDIYYTTNGSDPRKGFGSDQVFQYTAPIPLQEVTTVRTRVLDGQTWSALNEATFVVGLIEVGISEIHYHPSPATDQERAAGFTNADDFEFVELFNRGPSPCDLTGVRLTGGIEFDFTGAAVTSLGPGSHVVVVKDRVAFQLRYGPGFAVAGEYTGRLSNSGESVRLLDRRGWLLAEVNYSPAPPWPTSPDGTGPSLEVVDPNQPVDSVANWRASSGSGGTPGLPNSTEALTLSVESPATGFVRLRFETRAGKGYTLSFRRSLFEGSWQVLESGPAQPRAGPKEIILDVGTLPDAAFYRVSIP